MFNGRLCILLCLTLLFLKPTKSTAQTCSALHIEAEQFLARENELLRQRKHAENLATYNYNINVTDENRRTMIDVMVANTVANKKLAQTIISAEYHKIDDEMLRRQAIALSELGTEVLPEEEYKSLLNAISNMQTNYATVTVCSFTNAKDCGLQLEPHIKERMANSRDSAELAHYWRQWYDRAGTPMRANFAKYVELTKKAALMNKFSSNADYWIHFYEAPDFEKNLDEVYRAILPLYEEIHAYVRYRLHQHYADETVITANGNIPMHLLGNMWAQQWDNIIDLLMPFPDKPFIDVNAELRRQNYSVLKMFQLGDEFFKSLGMIPLPKSFWNLSVVERQPMEVPMICHASAWDLYRDSDVRIKMCTEVDMHYLYVVHHELGHIQYYLQYEKQATAFRRDPNPGFHEAVGDAIALSVATPRHLHRIGLSAVAELDEQQRINELFKTALNKIVFLPFAYTMDKYRYAIFREEFAKKKWNCAFWKMRSQYSGIEPPKIRTDSSDFDPPAKYHISADVEYLRYFAAHIFQFQFHKAMCLKAGQYKPNDPKLTLDNCDIYKSKAAGEAFSKMLSLGSSKHWKDALRAFTGETEMDPTALLEYFKPLHLWLSEENQRLNLTRGWTLTKKIGTAC